MAIEKIDPILAESEQVRKLKESYKYGWSDSTNYKEVPERGLSHAVIDMISDRKSEPEWMRKFRHKSLDRFLARPMPAWGADLSGIDFESIYYYIKPMDQVKTWEEMPAEIKSTWDKLGIPEAEKNYLGGVSVQYECLRGSTLIPTSRGFRAIKELDADDLVFSLDETTKKIVASRVLGKKESGEKEVFEIRARGRVIGASANHPFLVLRDERKPGRQRARFKTRWVPVEELMLEDLVAVATDLPEFGQPFSLIKPEAKDFPETTSDDLCWWLGVYLGDGFINHPDSYPSCAIAIDRTDESLVAEIRRVGLELFGLDFHIAKDGVRLRAKGTAALVEFLILNGLGGKSLTKRIPDWVFSLPLSQRLSFLAGYLDSDGHVRSHPKTKDVVFNTANQGLAEDLHELVILCGIGTSRVTKASQKHVYDKDRTMFTYQLHLSGRFDRIPARSRKAERLGKRRWYHKYNSARGTVYRSHVGEMFGFARVESITSVGVEATYDIEVENHHNFVAEGFIVHNSESVYHSTKKELEDKGVIFCDMDTALREYPDLVKEYWATVIPANDNKFSALNSAVWSGGSFIWVPEGVSVEVPLQAYFRINQENMGQFERTMIIVEPGAWVHYIEGCSAPVYSSDSLHSAVVEIIVKDHARARYTTVQNWSNNVYNLVTKRARAEEGAVMEWVDFNAGCLAQGSRVTTRSGMKPIELVVPGEEVLSYDEAKGELCWRQVRAKKYSGEQSVREVRLGMRRLLATDNHPFYSYIYNEKRAKKSGRYELAYVRADKLAKAIVPKTSIDFGVPWKLEMPELTTVFTGSNQYSAEFTSTRTRPSRLATYEETTDDIMWLFGLFAGDGSIEARLANNGGRRWAKVTFSVPRNDRARERLMEVMTLVAPGIVPTEREDGVAMTWHSVELADFFEKNGFLTGAREKRVPEWVFNLPESQRLSFVAGYLDSDGCAPRTRRGLSIKSVNRLLLEDVGEILASLGITAKRYIESMEERQVEIAGHKAVCRGSYWLEFPADQRVLSRVSGRLREAAESQSQPSLRHGRQVGRSQIELPETVEIRKVEVSEPLATVPTWDIEVEGTGNFVSEGFIVHNSKVTMKYPSVYLMGKGAKGEILSIAYAGQGQHQDAGGKVHHIAPYTESTIVSKSISKDGGRAGYRGLVRVQDGAVKSKSNVRCDALILDDESRSDTYPYMEIEEETASISHEATVSKIGDEQLFYLMSRGIDEVEASSLIVRGFIEPITKELPLEYAVEMNRLIELQMEGSVG